MHTPAHPAGQDDPHAGRDERDALDRLSRVHGEGSLRSAVLALVMEPEHEATRQARRHETGGVAGAAGLRADVARLSPASRVPVLEALLGRMRQLPAADRRALLQASRRVMAAHTPLRPLDRLHWFLMRRKLGDTVLQGPLPEPQHEIAGLSLPTRLQIASVTAYLSRIVPGTEPPVGRAWYDDAMQRLLPDEPAPRYEIPDGDGLASALDEVQTVPWMLRPLLLRAWVEAALATSRRGGLMPAAADALRIAAGLLDSPMPPELARQFQELNW